MNADILIDNATVVTMDPERRVLRDAAIAVVNDRIAAIGPRQTIVDTVTPQRLMDATGKVVLPGLIDCHGHGGHGMLRTLGADVPNGWINACEQIYTRGASARFWELDGYLMALERLRFGVTTGVSFLGGGGAVLTGDMAMRTESPLHGQRHCDAVGDVGNRDILVVGPRRSPFSHRYLQRDDDTHEVGVSLESYRETCEALIDRCHGSARGRIHIALMTQTHHPQLAEPGSDRHRELVAEARVFFELARQHGLLFMQDGHTRGTIEFADRELGILGSQTLLSHATDLTDADITACAATDTRVVHNPGAIASVTGRCPVPELLDAGVTVAIASDGLGPDRSCDLFRHMYHSMRYHRHHFRDPAYLPPGKVLEMVTCDAARALHLDADLGSLEVGKKADMILMDTRKPHLTPLLMPVHQLVNYANGNDVDTVLVDGKVLLDEGRVTGIDEMSLFEEIQAVASEAIEFTGLQNLLVQGPRFWGHSRV